MSQRSAFISPHRVHETQVARAREGGKSFFAGVIEQELTIVEGLPLRSDVAGDCRALFTRARADLAVAQEAGDALAKETRRIGLASAYRDPGHDLNAWQASFNAAMDRTSTARAALTNPLGDEALHIVVREYEKSKASPGFSNHTKGIAVDFSTTIRNEEGATRELGASHKGDDAWPTTWLHKWLVENAATFGFEPLATEFWHWDHRGAKGGFSATGDDSCAV